MPSFQFRLPIREDLTKLQRIAIDDDNSIIVTGVPGSGKTVVAIYRLSRLDLSTSRLFTYTKMLTLAIKNSTNQLQKEASVNVSSIYKWFWANCHTMLGNIIDDKEEINNCLTKNKIVFDELIFDEAQDLPKSLYHAFKSNFNKVSIGTDDAQMVFNNGTYEAEFKNEIFTENKCHELDQNFRNTYEIFSFAKNIVIENDRAQNDGMLARLKKDRRGDKPIIILYADSIKNEITNLRQIISDNIGGNIGILLVHRDDVKNYYNIILKELKFDCSYFYNEKDNSNWNNIKNDLKNILITTFKSAKGMEFDTVIIPEFQLINEELKQQFFVGSTRARSNLFLFCKDELPELLNNNIFEDTYTLIDNKDIKESQITDGDDLPF